MMEGVSATTLVTYIITSRAGLPPWNTRVDWVALAIDNWDLVDFSSLPLTREHVLKWYATSELFLAFSVCPGSQTAPGTTHLLPNDFKTKRKQLTSPNRYIPNHAWTQSATWSPPLRSPLSDPILVGADRQKIKAMANPASLRSHKHQRVLNEASPDACYCPGKNGHLPVFKNKRIQKYIPERHDHHHHHEHDHGPAFDARELATPKPQPKSAAGKVRLGRRAAKKAAAEAAAAAAAQQEEEEEVVAGPSQPPAPTAPLTGHAAIVGGPDSDDDDLPASERMLNLVDKFDEFVADLRASIQD
jgi:hypothetical protein